MDLMAFHLGSSSISCCPQSHEVFKDYSSQRMYRVRLESSQLVILSCVCLMTQVLFCVCTTPQVSQQKTDYRMNLGSFCACTQLRLCYPAIRILGKHQQVAFVFHRLQLLGFLSDYTDVNKYVCMHACVHTCIVLSVNTAKKRPLTFFESKVKCKGWISAMHLLNSVIFSKEFK